MRSTRSARFGRPVSASWVACLVSAACASCRSAIRSACAWPSRAISRSWALCALRSVNVRHVSRSPSTSSGESPDQDRHGDAVAVDEVELDGGAEPAGTAELLQPDGRPPATKHRERRSHDRLRRARQQLRQPPVGVQDEPARRERRRPVAHVLDEHPVRPVGGRQREDAPPGAAVGDDEGVDLARADRPQRVLRLGHPGSVPYRSGRSVASRPAGVGSVAIDRQRAGRVGHGRLAEPVGVPCDGKLERREHLVGVRQVADDLRTGSGRS